MVGTGATTRPGPARGTEQGTGLDTLQQLQGQRRPWALPDSDPSSCYRGNAAGRSICRARVLAGKGSVTSCAADAQVLPTSPGDKDGEALIFLF